jgi:alditol oxidase
LREQLLPLMTLMVIRTIKSDDFWLSSQSGHPADGGHVAIHFEWVPTKITEVTAILPTLDSTFAPFGARPHWGKFNVPNPRQFLPNYPKLNEFKLVK